MKIKKIIPFILSAALTVCASACNNAGNEKKDGLTVITTNFPPYDFVRQISGGDCLPETLLSGGQDSHSYEPTAQEMIRISEADIFICTGGESDLWVDELTDSLGDVKIIKMMDFIEPICSEHDHEGHTHTEYDEHIWTSPKNAMLIAEGLAAALTEADPENAPKYSDGLADYLDELTELDSELTAAAEKLTSPLIFGDRFPFAYMARDYGIDYRAAFSGCSSETEPSAAVMTELIEAAKEFNSKKIFYIEFSTEKVAKTVAEAVGAEAALFHSCHSVSDEDLNGGETYISLMRKNIEQINSL